MGLESLKKKSVLFDFAEGCSQWGTELLNQGTPCHPKWCHCQGRRLFTGCELRGQLPCAADASLGRTHLICTEMGTLGLVWHIFECFYYLYKPKFWRVSGLKASLSLWIMNLNAAFCVDYLMIHSNIAVASGCAEKIQDVFRWHLWCMAFLLWFIIQRYLFEKQIVWYQVIDYFSLVWRKPCWQAWKSISERGELSLLAHDSSGSRADSKTERLWGKKHHLLKLLIL